MSNIVSNKTETDCNSDKKYFISIILPCYNVDKYIEKALISVINQTLKNIEIICINDGSKDKTLDIINEFAQNDSRIKIYNQENQGQGCARNNGLKYAKAPYVAFMDPDDWIDPEMYEKLYNLIISNNLDFVECDFIQYFENSGELKNVKFNYPPPENKVFNYKDDKNYVFKGTSFSPCNKLFNKAFLLQNNIIFSDGKLSEDRIFTLKAKILAKRILYIHHPYYFYRIRKGSSVNSLSKDSLYVEHIIHELKEFMQSYGLTEYFADDIKNFVVELLVGHYNLCPAKYRKVFLSNVKKNVTKAEFREFYLKRNNDRRKKIENLFCLRNKYKFGIKYKIITFWGLKFEFKIK